MKEKQDRISLWALRLLVILSTKHNSVFANQFLFLFYAESSIQDGGIPCQRRDKVTQAAGGACCASSYFDVKHEAWPWDLVLHPEV